MSGPVASPFPPPPPTTAERLRAVALRGAWLLPLVPALIQLGLLAYAMLARVSYPYDLEWMEGGLLGHAARMADRKGIYVQPSLDFIPYLYTPLYPALIALLGGIFGVSYAVGRAISILSLLAVMVFAVAAVLRERDVHPRAALAGAAAACGFIAATYPWVEGWFDICRADSLYLAMIVGGLLGVRVWARVPGDAGQRRIAAIALVLAMSYFCKQTGVFYVAAGGAALLVLNWRRAPLYAAVAGAVGLGGTWLFNRVSGGWFWTYAFEIHQAHDFSRDRFGQSFDHMLLHFPVMTGLVLIALVAVGVSAMARRKAPPGCAALLYWSPLFAVSVLVGAIGWGTEFAHFNAFIPAMVIGAIAAGAALPALVGCASAWEGLPSWAGGAAGWVGAAAMAVQLGLAWWQPSDFIPDDRDEAAGDALIAHLRAIDGDVFMPYHPWYPVLAGKPLYTHRMGLIDVSQGKRMTQEQRRAWQVRGLREAFRRHQFAAVVLDNRPVGPELTGLREAYRMDDFLPSDLSPRVYTGAQVMPRSVWVPARPMPAPPGVHVLFDFEDGRLEDWTSSGSAWGRHPASGPVGNQGSVRRYGGRFYATSYHGGDPAVGTLASPEFLLAGSRITLRVSGGHNLRTLRVELWVGETREKIATGNLSERMDEVMWNVASYSGKRARIVLCDDEAGPWGHLNVDEIWLWK